MPNRTLPMAGLVDSIGKNVTRFQSDDEVFGETTRDYQWTNGGAYAENATDPEYTLALKPANVTFEQAAPETARPETALRYAPATRVSRVDCPTGGGLQIGTPCERCGQFPTELY